MDQVNRLDHHHVIKMVPEENYFARVYLTDNKGYGPEARRSVCRSDRIDGGRTLEKEQMEQRMARCGGTEICCTT